MSERFLVTGANGCIGAWVVRQLVAEQVPVVAYDASPDSYRQRLALDGATPEGVTHVQGDITDLGAFERTVDEHAITNIIHLAALQVPFCRADPPLGARVNVVGTVHVFEAAVRRADRMAPVVYASSIAAYDALDAADPGAAPDMSATPSTLYGVFKRANEGTAAVYWGEQELPSVGLRPHTVYGPGRDQGLTSAPTFAMLAAAAGQSFRLPFGGRYQLQYAPDVAGAFVAASRSDATGAAVHNLAGRAIHTTELVGAIEAAEPAAAGRITFEEIELPFPGEVDPSSLRAAVGELPDTPLDAGVADTIARFRRLLDAGLVEA
jgi:UDP-glucuronate 4-epimerase